MQGKAGEKVRGQRDADATREAILAAGSELFARYGLELCEASGQRNEIQIPRLKDWLRSNDGQAYKHAMCHESAIDRSMDEWVYGQNRWNHYFPPVRSQVPTKPV